MQNNIKGRQPIQHAKIAGILYLIIIVCGLFSEMFVRGSIIVAGDVAATTRNIQTAPQLFRLGFISDLIMTMCDVGVALLFYILLKPVSKSLSLLAAFFRLGQATIIGINLLNYFTPLQLISGESYLSGFNTDQLQSMVMLFLNMHSQGYLISGVFFGFSCIVLGYLFFRSPLFPKALGIFMSLASLGYLTDCAINFLAPEHAGMSEILVMLTAVPTELGLCAWLLIKGVKKTSI